MENNKEINTLSTIQLEITNEIGTVLSRYKAPSGLMAIIMSWGDTLTDEQVLEQLRDWNEKQHDKTATDNQIKDLISQFIFKETKDSHFASLVTSWNNELSAEDVLNMMKFHMEGDAK